MSTNKASFVYVVYISASPEKVWQALTDANITQQYWFNRRNENDSNWKTGSSWRHIHKDPGSKADHVGKVLESDRPRKLVVSWSNPQDVADASKVSRVTYELKAMKDTTCLTVSHTELEAGSKMHKGISEGWPLVLSSLKSFLETGKGLGLDATCK